MTAIPTSLSQFSVDVPVLPGFGDPGIGGASGTATQAAGAASSAGAALETAGQSLYQSPILSIGKWIFAIVIYLGFISFMTPKQAAGLSLLLVLGALLWAHNSGHDIFSTLGIQG